MAKYVLAIDQGTTSTRAIVFDIGGVIFAMGHDAHKAHPRRIHVEAPAGQESPQAPPADFAIAGIFPCCPSHS